MHLISCSDVRENRYFTIIKFIFKYKIICCQKGGKEGVERGGRVGASKREGVEGGD